MLLLYLQSHKRYYVPSWHLKKYFLFIASYVYLHLYYCCPSLNSSHAPSHAYVHDVIFIVVKFLCPHWLINWYCHYVSFGQKTALLKFHECAFPVMFMGKHLGAGIVELRLLYVTPVFISKSNCPLILIFSLSFYHLTNLVIALNRFE